MTLVKSKEVPMLFKGQMVRALIRTLNPKTETRRILESQPPFDAEHCSADVADDGTITFWSGNYTQGIYHTAKAKVNQGDTIYVKETFVDLGNVQSENGHIGAFIGFLYAADQLEYYGNEDDPERIDVSSVRWIPSLFMPRAASRIDLEVTESVRVERLQEISEKSALAEGFIKLPDGRVIEFLGADAFGAHWPTARAAYRDLWNDINLVPKPLIKDKQVINYVSYPWSNADFDAEYPSMRESGVFRGKPIKVIENPWVTVTTFRLKELRS